MKDSERIPRQFSNMGTQVVYTLMVPVFFAVFVLVYKPFHLEEYLGMSRDIFLFNTVIISCIIFVTLAITRTVFFFSFRKRRPQEGWYAFWCFCEIIIVGHFDTLYTWLMYRGQETYFSVLATTLIYSLLTLCLPYVIIGLSIRMTTRRRDIETTDMGQSVKFLDENKKLKLIIPLRDILFIEAKENYVNINYLNDNVVRSFLLRNTMKSIEDMKLDKVLIRCHRSYIVNAKSVKILRKNEEGVIFAELQSPEHIRIPVTRRYYEHLVEVIE